MASFSNIDSRALLDNLHAGVVVHGPSTEIIYANPAALRLLRLTKERMLCKDAYDPQWQFVDRFQKSMPIDDFPVNRVLRLLEPLVNLEVGVVDASSREITWLLCSAYPEFQTNGDLAQVVVTFTDVTIDVNWPSKANTEAKPESPSYQELADWKKRYELAMQGANDGMWDWDVKNNKVYFSARWKSMLGWKPEEISNHFEEFRNRLHPDDIENVEATINRFLAGETKEYSIECRMMHKQGHYIDILSRGLLIRTADGEPSRMVGTHVDISALKQSQQQLLDHNRKLKQTNMKLKKAKSMLFQQEKMASLGLLAAGVAHEINNPVGYIQSNIKSLKNYINDFQTMIEAYEGAEKKIGDAETLNQLGQLKEQLDLEFLKADSDELISESLDGVIRIVSIVKDLKEFSHTGAAEWEMADVIPCIEKALNIAHNELKYKAAIETHFGLVPKIRCLPSQLNQVFLNLLINAGHAIDKGGKIQIHVDSLDADNIVIEIRDNGSGIAKDKLDRIFDPFFTTKPVGKGTGLGLAIVYGIVQKHAGHISVESEENKGATFTIVLPISGGQDQANAQAV